MSDEKFMEIAMDAARKSYLEGQLPIGAVLVINNELVGVKSNSQVRNDDWFHHAENILIQENSSLIKKASKESNKRLFTQDPVNSNTGVPLPRSFIVSFRGSGSVSKRFILTLRGVLSTLRSMRWILAELAVESLSAVTSGVDGGVSSGFLQYGHLF